MKESVPLHFTPIFLIIIISINGIPILLFDIKDLYIQILFWGIITFIKNHKNYEVEKKLPYQLGRAYEQNSHRVGGNN